MLVLDGIQSLADAYDHFILDVWGVLHNGVRAFPGVADCLRRLKEQDKQIFLLSNSPLRAARLGPHLESLGIAGNLYDHVLTSGESAWCALEAHAGQKVYCFYDDENPSALAGHDTITRMQTPEEADFGLMSHLDHALTMEDYTRILERCKARNLPLICANSDKIVDVGGTLYPCAGSLADIYTAMGGNVSWHGKPHKEIYDRAFAMMGNPDKARVVAVGDSVRTDLTGAADYGIDALWNAVGIHLHEISDETGRIDNERIKAAVEHLPRQPHALLTGFRWA